MSKSLEERAISVTANTLGVKRDQVVPTANLSTDLGADSLDSIELIMALEEEFEIEISDEDAERIHTVQQIHDYVKAHVKDTE